MNIFNCFGGLVKIEGPPSYQKSLVQYLQNQSLSSPYLEDFDILLQALNGQDIKIRQDDAMKYLQMQVREETRHYNWVFPLKALYLLECCIDQNIQLYYISDIYLRGMQTYIYDQNYKDVDVEQFLDIYLQVLRGKAQIVNVPEPLVKLDLMAKRKMRMETMMTFQALVIEIDKMKDLEDSIIKLFKLVNQSIQDTVIIKDIIIKNLRFILPLYRTHVQAVSTLMEKKDKTYDKEIEIKYTQICINQYQELIEISEKLQHFVKELKSKRVIGFDKISSEQFDLAKSHTQIQENLQEQLHFMTKVDVTPIINITNPGIDLQSHSLSENNVILERESEVNSAQVRSKLNVDKKSSELSQELLNSPRDIQEFTQKNLEKVIKNHSDAQLEIKEEDQEIKQSGFKKETCYVDEQDAQENLELNKFKSENVLQNSSNNNNDFIQIIDQKEELEKQVQEQQEKLEQEMQNQQQNQDQEILQQQEIQNEEEQINKNQENVQENKEQIQENVEQIQEQNNEIKEQQHQEQIQDIQEIKENIEQENQIQQNQELQQQNQSQNNDNDKQQNKQDNYQQNIQEQIQENEEQNQNQEVSEQDKQIQDQIYKIIADDSENEIKQEQQQNKKEENINQQQQQQQETQNQEQTIQVEEEQKQKLQLLNQNQDQEEEEVQEKTKKSRRKRNKKKSQEIKLEKQESNQQNENQESLQQQDQEKEKLLVPQQQNQQKDKSSSSEFEQIATNNSQDSVKNNKVPTILVNSTELDDNNNNQNQKNKKFNNVQTTESHPNSSSHSDIKNDWEVLNQQNQFMSSINSSEDPVEKIQGLDKDLKFKKKNSEQNSEDKSKEKEEIKYSSQHTPKSSQNKDQNYQEQNQNQNQIQDKQSQKKSEIIIEDQNEFPTLYDSNIKPQQEILESGSNQKQRLSNIGTISRTMSLEEQLQAVKPKFESSNKKKTQEKYQLKKSQTQQFNKLNSSNISQKSNNSKNSNNKNNNNNYNNNSQRSSQKKKNSYIYKPKISNFTNDDSVSQKSYNDNDSVQDDSSKYNNNQQNYKGKNSLQVENQSNQGQRLTKSYSSGQNVFYKIKNIDQSQSPRSQNLNTEEFLTTEENVQEEEKGYQQEQQEKNNSNNQNQNQQKKNNNRKKNKKKLAQSVMYVKKE